MHISIFAWLIAFGLGQAMIRNKRGFHHPHNYCIIGKAGSDGWNLTVGYVGGLGTAENDKACQTRFEINGDKTIIYRSGKRTKACYNEAKSNPIRCYSDDAFTKKVRVCIFCCLTDQCNDFDSIPPM